MFLKRKRTNTRKGKKTPRTSDNPTDDNLLKTHKRAECITINNNKISAKYQNKTITNVVS